MMKILLGQNHLHTVGGSETFIYSMAKQMTHLGHQVDIVTMQPGFVSELINREFGCNINIFQDSYDIALLNHTTIVNGIKSMFPGGNIVQTCHGIYPELEQPVSGVKHVSISLEVMKHLKTKGYDSTLIHNGIDCQVFAPLEQISPGVKKVFSLSQSDTFNQTLASICKKRGLKFSYNNKFTSPRIDIHNAIRDSDMVFSLGRGAYEAMACARSIIVADQRQYQPGMMDGIITSENISSYLENNCSGRKMQREVTEESLISEIEKYDSTQGVRNRQFALSNLNIVNQVEEYLKL